MITRIQLFPIVALVGALWAAYLFAAGESIPSNWFRPLNAIVGCVFLSLLAFDRWVWKWKALQGWFVHRPVIGGTWKVVLERVGSEGEPAITCYMAVRQTYSTLSLKLLSPESKSETVAAEIARSDADCYRVMAVYRNEPSIGHRERSPIHNGSFILEVVGDPPTRLDGHYWTDRETKGSMRLEDRVPTICQSFEDADRGFFG